MGSSCPTFSSRVSQSVIITRGPGTRPDTLDGCRHCRTAESVVCQVLGFFFLFFPSIIHKVFPAEGQHAEIWLQSVDWLAGIIWKPKHSPLSQHASAQNNGEFAANQTCIAAAACSLKWGNFLQKQNFKANNKLITGNSYVELKKIVNKKLVSNSFDTL